LWNYQGFKPEGSILKEKNWNKFIDKPNPETIPFLINKLDSKIETKIHLCTWKDATEGELALLCSKGFNTQPLGALHCL